MFKVKQEGQKKPIQEPASNFADDSVSVIAFRDKQHQQTTVNTLLATLQPLLKRKTRSTKAAPATAMNDTPELPPSPVTAKNKQNDPYYKKAFANIAFTTTPTPYYLATDRIAEAKATIA